MIPKFWPLAGETIRQFERRLRADFGLTRSQSKFATAAWQAWLERRQQPQRQAPRAALLGGGHA